MGHASATSCTGIFTYQYSTNLGGQGNGHGNILGWSMFAIWRRNIHPSAHGKRAISIKKKNWPNV